MANSKKIPWRIRACMNVYKKRPKVKYLYESEFSHLLGRGISAYVCPRCGYYHVGHISQEQKDALWLAS